MGMDRRIERKRFTARKVITFVLGVLLVAVVAHFLLFNNLDSTLRVQGNVKGVSVKGVSP